MTGHMRPKLVDPQILGVWFTAGSRLGSLNLRGRLEDEFGQKVNV